MHLQTRNVNTAFRELVNIFRDPETGPGMCGYQDNYYHTSVVKRPSRNGNVLMIDEPVTVTYTHPRERVLFNAARDANPFFHLYESLWMLAGRNDVASAAYYARQMSEYSDDGKTLNGAYGHRWRHANSKSLYNSAGLSGEVTAKHDQLDLLVAHLKADPTSRRAVLQMWNVEDDLLKIGKTGSVSAQSYDAGSKDVCCNLSVMFSLREVYEADYDQQSGFPPHKFLDMTVINRSNDMVWGMLGANYVHFTFLQEYMAARLGVAVGLYHHFSNNLHVYDWNWKPDEWLNEHEELHNVYASMEDGHQIKPFPLIKNPEAFERELFHIVDTFNGANVCHLKRWTEPFLEDVVKPVLTAFQLYKDLKDSKTALLWASKIKADDWRLVCTAWLERRNKSAPTPTREKSDNETCREATEDLGINHDEHEEDDE